MARGKKKETLTPEERLQAALVPESEQPYKVPENWCWVRLGASINLYNGDRGTNYPSKKDYQSSGISFINAGAIVDGELNEAEFNYISEDKYDALRAGKIQQGDILYCLRGSLGKTAIVQQKLKGAISSSLCILRTNESLLKEFLYYLLCSNVIGRQQILAENGSAQPNLSAASVMEYMIPLPPFYEQQRIVDRIESLFAKLDEAKQKAQDALDSFETRKAAILDKAFTGELTAQWRKEHGVGMESWQTKKYSEICNIVRGGSPRPAGSPEFYGGNIPFMKVADITRNAGPYVNLTEYTIKEAGLKKTRMVDKNTLLLTNSGATLGVPAICTFKTTFNDGIAAFLGLNPDTLLFHYYFWTSKTADLRAINKGAAQPNLNTEIIGNVEISLPREKEQREIVRILDDLLAKEQHAKEVAEGVLEQIDLIKKTILARAFRGELGTNDPSEESAVELVRQLVNDELK
ncbi:restriction endonuclease subunit S [Intestinibacillus massiliensis]|nr:restriction endonuclease subunit S [Intestinibacillus massiliensis]